MPNHLFMKLIALLNLLSYHVIWQVNIAFSHNRFVQMWIKQLSNRLYARDAGPAKNIAKLFVYQFNSFRNALVALSLNCLSSSFEVVRDNKQFLNPVSYTHLRAHETRHDLVCR